MARPAPREAMTLEPLTDLERAILEYLIEYLRRNTFQPSIREIGKRFAIRSTKTVSEHLQSLEDKGWIERDPARSRGVRILGLELNTDAVAVPPLTHAGYRAAPLDDPARYLTLDRRLVGSTRAAYLPMPDDSLVGIGIHKDDLLLLEPVAPEDLEPGDIVVASPAGELTIRAWGEPGPNPVPPFSRVAAILRRFRAPESDLPFDTYLEADAETYIP